ncbi:kinase-like protein [Coccomyxa subellipsoidea C-169]|uniref:Kinase-like protein n=1 Tax=Coccomyxa subellipsoidea (strain C-169) TaxID=574566 RepID=I0YND0_COCSC|nr:kinase-like protein [Coccomyxa subellipsoidea C-169]EIE19899.1 kinase-like protein [Coccomyxa subellipsoidea C-169]|eukprot:XP_005644443.1 kinase-like protein [Coccomyxa subellipsoidea C-169]
MDVDRKTSLLEQSPACTLDYASEGSESSAGDCSEMVLEVRSAERTLSAGDREGPAKRSCHAAHQGPLGSPRSSRQRRWPAGGSSKAWWLGPTALAGECFQEDFTLIEGGDGLLGRGTFGSVRRCILNGKGNGQHFAVKIIKLNRYEDRQAVGRERRALEKMKGAACAVQLHRVYAEQHAAFLVFELLENGSTLEETVRWQSGRRLACTEARKLCRALLQAVAEVHDSGICLLDIKPANVWISAQGSPEQPFRVCLLDFGMAHEFVPGKAVRLAAKSALAGTPAYMAPEVIQANLSHCSCARFSAFNGKKASPADAWSVGVTLFQACFGRLPFQPPAKALDLIGEMSALHASWAAAVKAGQSMFGATDGISDTESQFWSQVLACDPADRPTASELLQHPHLSEGA